MHIETERLVICDFCIEDVNDLFEILSDKEVMKYIEPPYTYVQTQEFIQEAGLSEEPMVFALKMKPTGKMIGHIIYHLIEKDDFEIGWILNRKYWGFGIVDEVTKALIQEAKKERISGLVIECVPDQMVSKHIALKNGFHLSGQEAGCDIYRRKL